MSPRAEEIRWVDNWGSVGNEHVVSLRPLHFYLEGRNCDRGAEEVGGG